MNAARWQKVLRDPLELPKPTTTLNSSGLHRALTLMRSRAGVRRENSTKQRHVAGCTLKMTYLNANCGDQSSTELTQGNLKAVINRFQLLQHFISNLFTHPHGYLSLRSGNQDQRSQNNCSLLIIINLTNQYGTKINADDTLNHVRSYC